MLSGAKRKQLSSYLRELLLGVEVPFQFKLFLLFLLSPLPLFFLLLLLFQLNLLKLLFGEFRLLLRLFFPLFFVNDRFLLLFLAFKLRLLLICYLLQQ